MSFGQSDMTPPGGTVSYTAPGPDDKKELPGDQFAKAYIKTPKSLYCYFDDILDAKKELKVLLVNAGDKKEIEFEGFYWSKSGGIVFKNAEKWKGFTKGGDYRKVVSLRPVAVEEGRGMDKVHELLQSGYELFGKDFSTSVVVFGDKLIIGLVKKE